MTDTPRACPLCAATTSRLLLKVDAFSHHGEQHHIVTCGACGLRYTRPLPTPAELERLYADEYYVNNKQGIFSGDILRVLFQRTVLWRHQQALLDRPPGRILDIGCGNGDFLATLKRRGWEVYGTEFSAAGAALARAKGITVHDGDLKSASFPDGFFDVVTLWHVLEHLPEPLIELAEARRILRDDGLLVIEVPDSASPTFRLCRAAWYPLDAPRHLQHFTPLTSRKLLRQASFESAYQQNFHHWDFTYAFYSFLRLMGANDFLSIDVFSTTYKRASVAFRFIFLVLGLSIGLLCLPYSVLSTMLSGHGELVTITAHKAPVPTGASTDRNEV